MRLCLAVRAYRESLKLSLRATAKNIGIDYTALQRFETGERVEARQFVKIFLWLLEPVE